MSDKYGNLVVGLREDIRDTAEKLGMVNTGFSYGLTKSEVLEMTMDEFVDRCVAIELENMYK